MIMTDFAKKHGLTAIIIVAVFSFAVCVWSYMNFLKEMQASLEHIDVKSEQAKISIPPEIIGKLTTSSKIGDKVRIIIPTETLKKISFNGKAKDAKAVKIPAELINSLSPKK